MYVFLNSSWNHSATQVGFHLILNFPAFVQLVLSALIWEKQPDDFTYSSNAGLVAVEQSLDWLTFISYAPLFFSCITTAVKTNLVPLLQPWIRRDPGVASSSGVTDERMRTMFNMPMTQFFRMTIKQICVSLSCVISYVFNYVWIFIEVGEKKRRVLLWIC